MLVQCVFSCCVALTPIDLLLLLLTLYHLHLLSVRDQMKSQYPDPFGYDVDVHNTTPFHFLLDTPNTGREVLRSASTSVRTRAENTFFLENHRHCFEYDWAGISFCRWYSVW